MTGSLWSSFEADKKCGTLSHKILDEWLSYALCKLSLNEVTTSSSFVAGWCLLSSLAQTVQRKIEGGKLCVKGSHPRVESEVRTEQHIQKIPSSSSSSSRQTGRKKAVINRVKGNLEFVYFQCYLIFHTVWLNLRAFEEFYTRDQRNRVNFVFSSSLGVNLETSINSRKATIHQSQDGSGTDLIHQNVTPCWLLSVIAVSSSLYFNLFDKLDSKALGLEQLQW